jgi:hypothetical protein
LLSFGLLSINQSTAWVSISAALTGSP